MLRLHAHHELYNPSLARKGKKELCKLLGCLGGNACQTALRIQNRREIG